MYEYRVIPAPVKGKKTKGAKTAEERFAVAMTDLFNEMAADGWEYQRAETLPSEERKGLTGRTTAFRNLLVFRRLHDNSEQDAAPALVNEEVPAPTRALPSATTANALPDEAPTAPGVTDHTEGAADVVAPVDGSSEKH